MAVIAEWVLNWLKIWQAQADAKYADDLKVYEQNRTDWVTNNIHGREIGAPVTPPPAIPKHRIWSVDESGLKLKSEDVQDPGITDPVLPPPVPVSKATLSTAANATQDAMMAVLLGCLQLLSEMKAELAEVKRKLGDLK